MVRVLRVACSVISWFPLAWLIGFYSFVLAAALQPGDFFSCNPNGTELKVWHEGIVWFAIFTVYGLPVWLTIFVVYLWKKMPLPHGAWVFLFGWALVLAQMFWDPFYILPWFLD